VSLFGKLFQKKLVLNTLYMFQKVCSKKLFSISKKLIICCRKFAMELLLLKTRFIMHFIRFKKLVLNFLFHKSCARNFNKLVPEKRYS